MPKSEYQYKQVNPYHAGHKHVHEDKPFITQEEAYSTLQKLTAQKFGKYMHMYGGGGGGLKSGKKQGYWSASMVQAASKQPKLIGNFENSGDLNMLIETKEHFETPPQTQKVRGILHINRRVRMDYGLNRFISTVPVLAVYKAATGKRISKPLFQLNGWLAGRDVDAKAFMRPCPIKPMHGFLESKPVASQKVVKAYCKKVSELDPKGELIIMPWVPASSSAIVTEGLVSIGMGHSGATSGQQTFDIRTPKAFGFHYVLGQHMPITQSPYLELLWEYGDNKAKIVQLRDGPATPENVDFIPKDFSTHERTMLQPKAYTLVAYEQLISNIVAEGKQDEYYVYAPKASITSHPAIHAIEAGIPFLASYGQGQPHLPEIVTKNTDKDDLTNHQLAKMATYFAVMQKNQLSPFSLYSRTLSSFSLFHCIGAMHNTNEENWIKCVAISEILRSVAIVCLGEMRHCQRMNAYDGSFDEQFMALFGFPRFHHDRGRSDYYDTLNGVPSFTLLTALREARNGFFSDYWYKREKDDDEDYYEDDYDDPPDKSCAYGGERWGQIADHCLSAYAAIAAFMKDPTKPNWVSLLGKANNAVTAVHNGGGTAISKVINERTLEYSERVPGLTCMTGPTFEAANMFWIGTCYQPGITNDVQKRIEEICTL